MKYNLDSAMVLVLRDAIKWESSLVTYAGTLTSVSPALAIDPLVYQRRDRELAFRDLITAAAIVETSVQVSDVWNAAVLKPQLQGPTVKDMPEVVAAQMNVTSGNASQIRHVQNSSIPLDAARYADADLYGRDCLIYETIAQVAQSFTDPPLTRIDSHGTIFNADGTYAWSLGEGAPARADINAALPLSLGTFKQADQNLADRDNQLAGYTAQLAAVLKNPFEYAMRLYVQVNATLAADQRESEVYTLESADATERVWVCEPALSQRNKFVYNIANKTLQWFRESDTEVHQPQLVAMTVPGIVAGQTIITLPSVPEGKDCQYWRSKAAQVKPPGAQLVDVVDIPFTSDPTYVQGGVFQPDSASITVPGQITFQGLPVLAADHYRVSLLVKPDPRVEIMGNQNIDLTNGTLGGATYGLLYNPNPAALPNNLQYLVVGGDGVVYGAVTYTAGAHFHGNPLYTDYTYAGAVASVVNQYAVNFNLALPPGPWTMELNYTNLQGTTTGFGIRSQFIAQGQPAVDVLQDLMPSLFPGNAGEIATTQPAAFEVPFLSEINVPAFSLPVYWTYGNGSLSVRSVVFESALPVTTSGSYVLNAAMAGQNASAYVTAERLLPEIIRFDFTTAVPSTGTMDITWINSAALYDQSKYVPLKIKQLSIQHVTAYAATPLADEFQGWRQECLERAEAVIQQNYDNAVVAYGTEVPTFRGSGSNWAETETENWMGFVEIYNPRLREIANIPYASLVPGRQYEVTTGGVAYDSVTYASVGDRFYATESGGTNYAGGMVKQVGAFMKSRPGHLGKPALVPFGLYFTSYGTASAYYDTPLSYPVVAACSPWMIDAGLYVAQSDFWMPENI